MSTKCQPRQRIQHLGFLQVVRAEVSIDHGGLQTGMAENLLQRQDVPAIHHEVAGEGVTQDMCELALHQLNAGLLHCHTECSGRAFKYPA